MINAINTLAALLLTGPVARSLTLLLNVLALLVEFVAAISGFAFKNYTASAAVQTFVAAQLVLVIFLTFLHIALQRNNFTNLPETEL